MVEVWDLLPKSTVEAETLAICIKCLGTYLKSQKDSRVGQRVEPLASHSQQVRLDPELWCCLNTVCIFPSHHNLLKDMPVVR